MTRKEPDLNSLLIIQDLMEIFYKINRIKDNSYDQSFKRQFDNMPPIDKAQNMLRYISKNTDSMTRKNADIFINILKNIDEINNNENYNKNNRNNRNNRNNNYYKYRSSSNLDNRTKYANNSMLNKLKYFLKSLNDE